MLYMSPLYLFRFSPSLNHSTVFDSPPLKGVSGLQPVSLRIKALSHTNRSTSLLSGLFLFSSDIILASKPTSPFNKSATSETDTSVPEPIFTSLPIASSHLARYDEDRKSTRLNSSH